MTTREWNLHELARVVVDDLRVAHADLTIELEHRGDGEAELDAEALCASLESLLRAASGVADRAATLWIRTDGRGEDLLIDVRWRGLLVPCDLPAAERTSDEGEARVLVRIPRR